MRVRDPVHGTITVSPEEAEVVDSRFYQRLRHVRQLGFGELAFPGATHTRHAHALGAMHVASRLFDAMTGQASLSGPTRSRFRTAVRLAVLCHDLGHMPLSHASERIAPRRRALQLPRYMEAGHGPDALATHEDVTARIVLGSSLTGVIEQHFGALGVTPAMVVGLVTGHFPPGWTELVEGGVDWTPALRAIVSGELDADRMDYLLRDSFFTGVNYGRYDIEWILQNLSVELKDGAMVMALSGPAVFAFEDFLLSRYHMFLSVYYHHTSVSFDYMLRRFYEDSPGEFEIPAEPEAFLQCDDVALHSALRRSGSPWAQRIVSRRGFKRVAQFTERDVGYDLGRVAQALTGAGVEHFTVESLGILSTYFADDGAGPSLFVVDRSSGRLTEVAAYTPLYQRYAGAVKLVRVYVRPDQVELGREVVSRTTG